MLSKPRASGFLEVPPLKRNIIILKLPCLPALHCLPALSNQPTLTISSGLQPLLIDSSVTYL